jgi:outer membrane protein, adhesin transport system
LLAEAAPGFVVGTLLGKPNLTFADINRTRSPAMRLARLAFAAAGVALLPATALAAEAGSAEAGSAEAGADANPRPEWREPAAATSASPAQESDASAPQIAPALSPAVVNPLSGQPVLYGPPAPKAEKGKLPEVAWPQAPDEVPAALDEAVRLVTRNYPSASSARATLRASATDVKAAKWLRFPSVEANIAYRDSDNSPQPQVTVQMPLWTGGRIQSTIRRAQSNENVSSARYVETVELLARQTAQTYFQIVSLTQREKLLADSLKEHGRLVETMERRVKQDVSPLADLELARSRAAQIEQEYTITRSQRQTALRVMAQLVADPDYDLGPVPYYDPADELINRNSLEDEAVAFDPTISRLRSEADVARAEADQSRAAILPRLSAQYSYDEFFKSRVGLAVSAQSSGGLAQFSQAQGARIRVDAVLEQVRVVEQELRREIAADIIEYEAAKTRATISRSASETAGNVSASYVRQFIAGRRSWLDVMNALREAVTAQTGRVDAEVSAMSAAVRLLIRSGRWRPQFPKDAAEQRPY